jgi:hypothetical protein
MTATAVRAASAGYGPSTSSNASSTERSSNTSSPVFGDYSAESRRRLAARRKEDTVPEVDWYIEELEFSNCNCDYACPCQFESLRPTHGHCRGFAAVRIDRGTSER